MQFQELAVISAITLAEIVDVDNVGNDVILADSNTIITILEVK